MERRSTQNQALPAILFFDREVSILELALKIDSGL
jgi:hypothetical protein